MSDITDPRHIENGLPIPTEGAAYLDQPYVVKTKSGKWLCMMTLGTTGEMEEDSCNASFAALSSDQGQSWTPFKKCNRLHYAIPYITQSGRIYSISPLAFTFSDDEGETWSAKSELGFFKDEHSAWSVCPAKEIDGKVYIIFARIGLPNPPRETDVFLLVSDNLATETDPEKIEWYLLPKNDEGIRGPDWSSPDHRSEEPHFQQLSDGTFYCVFRTDQGHIATAKSTDKGLTWTPGEKLRYANTGAPIKQPLACPSLWKCNNGKFLLFVHNNGRSYTGTEPWEAYADRNPAWLCGGIEKDGDILWSQPDICLYLDNISNARGRISYPGFLEDAGKTFIFETEKEKARTHEIPQQLLDGLWNQLENKTRVTDSIQLEVASPKPNREYECRKLPPFASKKNDTFPRGGFCLDFILTLTESPAAGTPLSTLNENEEGFEIRLTNDGRLQTLIADNQVSNVWKSDAGHIRPGKNHVSINIDGGPCIISYVINGAFNDGGETRQFGWGRFGRNLFHVNSGSPLRIGDMVSDLTVYHRVLTTSEAIGNFRNYKEYT